MTAPVSVLVILSTIIGFIKIPSFAIAEIAVIICNGVILSLCPKDIVASSTSATLDSLVNRELDSPYKLLPVVSNSP